MASPSLPHPDEPQSRSKLLTLLHTPFLHRAGREETPALSTAAPQHRRPPLPRRILFALLLFITSIALALFHFAGEPHFLADLRRWWTTDPPTAPQETLYPSFPVDISPLFNNIAAGPGADFDPHSHGRFPAEYLPTKEFVYDRIKFILPKTWTDGKPDNLVVKGERLYLGSNVGFTREMHILYSGDWVNGESGARFTFHFEDGTSELAEVSAKNWWTLHWMNQGVIRTPYHITPEGKNHNLTQIYHWSTTIRTLSPLRSVTLPTSTWPNHVHLFALSFVPSVAHPHLTSSYDATPRVVQHSGSRPIPKISLQQHTFTPAALHWPHSRAKAPISIRRAIYTTKWTMIHGFKAYMVEVYVTNPLPGLFAANEDLWVRGRFYIGVTGRGVETARYGIVKRIMPSDEVKVKVWIVSYNGASLMDMDAAMVRVTDEEGFVVDALEMPGVARSFSQDVSERDTPEWWDDAKFGIFIHWGLYSVPAWSPDGWYAAWYDWWLHKWTDSGNGFWNYHLETYGPDVVYDDFIANFTAAKFNASEWINLFVDGGAKYFVPVTKHHDGFALFDTKNTTHRSSFHLGPKRDFIRELFDTAKKEHPDLKRGTYFSMPEWFNPSVGPGGYGWGDWPGFPAHNAYNYSKVEPYTGHIYGNDYLRDQQLEQMRMLAMDYETELMWCDIGGPNLSKEFAEEWYPFAEKQGRQVVMNNRCGDIPQFDTPEYTRFSSIQRTKWETSEGIDPYCYSYNRRTRPDQYRSVQTILHTLIDIVSKNGNYLLNLGPTAEGIFIAPMVERMLEVGKWLKHSGDDCIYGTDYFSLGAEFGNLRFTQKNSTFCIISLSPPVNGVLDVGRQVPVMKGDTITLLGAGEAGRNLTWRNTGDRTLQITVPDNVWEKVKWAWAFKVDYEE